MELRTAYKYIASGRFSKYCDENKIDLKNTNVQIKHFSETIIERESRLIVNMESFLMKQIEDLVFSFYMNEQDNKLLSLDFCIKIKDINGKYHELY